MDRTSAKTPQIGQITPATAVLASLNQVLSTSSLYPAGHNRFNQAAQQFHQDMEALGGGGLEIIFEDGSLFIGDEQLPASLGQAERLYSLFKNLGLSNLNIYPDFKLDELHSFASTIKKLKHSALDAKGFKQLDFSKLPKSIQIKQREFANHYVPHTTDEEEANAPGSMESLQKSMLKTVATKAPDQASKREWEEVITKIFTKVVEHVDQDRENRGIPFEHSIREVLEQGLPGLQKLIADNLEDAAEKKALNHVCETALPISDGNKPICTILKTMLNAAQDSQKTSPIPEVKHSTDHELRHGFLSYTSGAKAITRIIPENNCELLEILSHVLMTTTDLKLLPKVSLYMQNATSGRFQQKELTTLLNTTREILDQPNMEVIDRCLPWIMQAVRQSKTKLLPLFLVELCKTNSAPEGLWPHLVNELLLGVKKFNSNDSKLLFHTAGSLPETDMVNNLSRLERLPALAQGQLSRTFFESPCPDLFPLYAVLLDSNQGEIIGDLLCKSIALIPATWPGMEALKFIHSFQYHHTELLSGLLKEDGKPKKSKVLRMNACQFINDGLLSLSPTEWEKPWVSATIKALGLLQCNEGRPALIKITSQRKSVFFKAWPTACRKEAEFSLHQISTKPSREA